MLERVDHDNGVVTYQSPLLRACGVVHAFSTRCGGVSSGAYASLNLASLEKRADTDFNTAVAENFRRLRAALGCGRAARVEARQVHGAAVWAPPAELVKPADAPQADAMVTDQRGKLLTVRVADCVPVLLAARDGSVVSAVHAGWRGVVAGVVPAAVQRMGEQFGVDANDVVAALGPHISAAHFEVGDEVVDAFERAALGEAVQHHENARPHIDLARATALQLDRAGIPAAQVEMTDCCTYRDAELFYSYRRDGAQSGRLAAVIAVA